MELSDVVNAHFAFPVVGVVLCAVLVFAFGFKSPGEPPSFDALDDDDKKSKKTRQRKQTHSEKKHGNADVVDSAVRGPVGATRQVLVTSSSGGGTVGGRSIDGKTTALVPAANNVINAVANKLKTVKLVKKPEDTDVDANESLRQQDAAVIGDWTTAVSRKDRKNRGRRDDTSRHERTSLSDGPSHKTEISNYSPTPGSNKSKTKLSEMPKVTVTVPASNVAHSSVATATTSTTVTKNAVVKLKVVPPVHVVSNGNSVVAASSPSNHQVHAGYSAVGKETCTSAPDDLTEVAPPSVVNESASMSIEEDGYDGWSQVKSAKSPRRRKCTASDSIDNQKVIASGVTVQSTSAKHSTSSETVDAPSVVIATKSSPPSASKSDAQSVAGRSCDVGVKLNDSCASSDCVQVQAPGSKMISSLSVSTPAKSDLPTKPLHSNQGDVKIDVGALSRLPESSHSNSSSSSPSAATAADCHQSTTTTPGDTLTPDVTCSGTQVQVDINADMNAVQSSEETGDWHEAISLKRRKKLRKDT